MSEVLFTERFAQKRREGKEPEWRIRLSKKLDRLRREVNRLEQAKQRDYDDTYRIAVENEHDI